jgi:hypothetical protein
MRELESKFGPDHPAILSIKKQIQWFEFYSNPQKNPSWVLTL